MGLNVKSSSKVPILDLTSRQDLKPNTSTWRSISREACEALEEYGCFVAVYDGVTQQLDDTVFAAAEELFDLPTETKRRNVNEKPYHGYVGQMPVIPLHEGLGIDYVTNKEDALSFTHLMWPQGNHQFCQTAHGFSNAVAELDRLVVRMIFDKYGVEKHYDSHVESKTYLLKFLKYLAPPESISMPAFPQHTDKTFLSILHQNDVNGLEVKSKDGEWISLLLPPKSYVVMAGDISMGWSNDRIRSCEHRVTMEGDKTRYTLGLFSFVTGMVPEELVDDEHPLMYKPFDNIALIHFYATKEGREAKSTLKAYCDAAVWEHPRILVGELLDGDLCQGQTVHTYSNAVDELDRVVVRMIFEYYGIAKHYGSHLESKTYLLRFLRYLAPQESTPTLALPEHTDKTFLSILHHNDVNGLEVKLKNGEWISLQIPPKSYVVMAGDISMGWSNDRIHSCEHRVTMAGDKTRYTLALFSFVTGTVSVPEELVDDEHPLMYKPFDNIALINFYATKESREAKSTLKAYCGI